VKIVYIHQYFRTRQMSGGTRSFEMARRLVAMGHEVDLVTSDNEPPVGASPGWRITNEDGIRVHWYPVPYSNNMSYSDRIKSFFAFAWKSARRAASISADVIYASSTPLTVALPGVYAARKQRIPMVFEVRDLWPDMPISMGALNNRFAIAAARRLERFAYRRSKHVVALSPEMKAGVTSRGKRDDEVTVIPNGCDLDLFPAPAADGAAFRAAHAWLGDRPLVLYAGAVAKLNGLEYLVELALQMLGLDPEVRFLLVGNGNDRDRLRDKARSVGVLDRNLFFIDSVRKSQVPAVLSAATIATSTVVDVPGVSANSANKFFDSLAAARPIAINHVGWLADIIREKDCGLVLPPHDVPAAARQVIAAVRNESWLRDAGIRARQTAERLFDRDRLAAKLESVLNTAVERQSRKEQES
jgi:glycosyltransferase involved in cell wall biosynthesis